MARVHRRWWTVELWKQRYRCVPSGRCLHRPDSQGREAGRSAGGADDESRTIHQSQDCQGARPYYANRSACACRRGDRVKRREFITLLGGASAWPLAARAQSAGMLKVGMVAAGSPSRSAPNILAFRQRLSDLGYREGNNLTFEFAHATDVKDFARGYRELVARKMDILVAPGPEIALHSALAATDSLPIVMVAIDYD